MSDGKQVTIPRGAWDAFMWLSRGAVVFSCGVMWTMYNDIKDINYWRKETLIIQMAADAKQVQTQITAVDDRSKQNAQMIQMLMTELNSIQVQIARLEERRGDD